MTDAARFHVEPSPVPKRVRTPRWFDLRLVTGILLILASVIGGAIVVGASNHRQARWAVTRDLAAGTVLAPSDLRSVRVQLGSADRSYLSVTEAVVGRAVNERVPAGSLLTRSALGPPPAGVSVTIPLRPDNGPKIGRGDRITVWLSTKTCQGQVLVSGVPVQSVTQSGDASFGSDGGSVLIVNISAVDARRVVSALDLEGAVIRAGLLSPGQAAEPVAADLGPCKGSSS